MKVENEYQKLAEEFLNLKFPFDDLSKLVSVGKEGQKFFDSFHDWQEYLDSFILIYLGPRKNWTEKELDNIIDWLCQPFLEQHAVSANVRYLISEENTPGLFRTLELSEQLRPILLQAFRSLKDGK